MNVHAYAINERKHRLEECEPGTLGALHVGRVASRCSTWARTLGGQHNFVTSHPRPDVVARAAGIVSGIHALVTFGVSAAS